MISNKISFDPKVQEHILAILAPMWNMSTASYLYGAQASKAWEHRVLGPSLIYKSVQIVGMVSASLYR